MDDDFQSLSRGVFVVPFNPAENAAGPSRPTRPLKRVYDATYEKFEIACRAFERERMEEQLDDISDWLESRAATPMLKKTSGVTRISVAIMQDMAESLPVELKTLSRRVHTLQARDAMDLTAGIRNIALGFGLAKKGGKSGMDEVEEWYLGQKDRSPLLLHIQQAQLIPPAVLSELLYILAIHPKVPIKVLLTVSSTSLFLSSWSHVEPGLIDLAVIQSAKGRKRGAAVDAILKVASDPRQVPLSLSEDLVEDLRDAEEATRGGSMAVLKALKWALLHHSFNSPLAAVDPSRVDEIHTIDQGVRDGKDVPGREILQLDSHPDLFSILDPAPRISILHALSHPDAFLPQHPDPADVDSTPKAKGPGSPQKKRSRRAPGSTPTVGEETGPSGVVREGGDLRELQTLFGLWKSAGRNVNLWDWLEGFRASMAEKEEGQAEAAGEEEAVTPSAKRARRAERGSPEGDDTEAHEGDENGEKGVDGEDFELQDRQHAAFIRFCEEARMLGLVRARGGRSAKRTDEVVKGVGVV
ncbi:hypothetical protein DB88DRAFT_527142 [Papiliotrema laurentii]|uniref:Origin recognition complex subunit 3 winged helix C-terminal domain-containing protein n=1 Tax=Papiliotrema laurentii TaxID=5418 RepID=A0AAD9CYF7_PAPLA|nr:hypothetical protein DB88DRAFT_527142 [Papiliotrema laurentii]